MSDLLNRLKRLPKEKRAHLLKHLRSDVEKNHLQKPELVRRERGDYVVASYQQEQLWFIDQFSSGGRARNNVASIFFINQALNVQVLNRALQEIVQRHESLRTRFKNVNGLVNQEIVPHIIVNLPVMDLRGVPAERREQELERISKEESAKPFDLENGPVFRYLLFHLQENEYALLWVAHHIVWDPGSLDVFKRELLALYDAFLKGEPSPLEDLAIQYADFAIWQKEVLQGKRLQSLKDFWKEQLKGLEVTEIPTDYPRPKQVSYEGARVYHPVNSDLLPRIKELSRRQGTTLYMTLLAAFKVLLHHYTGSDDIVVGTPGENRPHPDLEKLIGFFVNMLVLRTNLNGDITFIELLNRVRETALEAFTHQDLPFEKVVETVNPVRDSSRHPLFQIEFTLQSLESKTDKKEDGLVLSHKLIHDSGSRFDLSFIVQENPNNLVFIVEYNTKLFKEITIQRLMIGLERVLERVVDQPEQRISEISPLSQVDLKLLMEEWGKGPERPIPQITLHKAFEDQVRKTPYNTAISFEDTRISYKDLKVRVNKLAHYLINKGVMPQDRVGICVERSIEMVVAILATLKVGGTYIPMEPTYPQERINFILSDAGAKFVITQDHLRERFPSCHLVIVQNESEEFSNQPSADLPETVDPTSLAYIIYTSGSTGKPKGVMIEHRSVINFILAISEAYGITSQDRILQFASIGFDVSVFDIFTALLTGAELCIANDLEKKSPDHLKAMMNAKGVTVAELPPALLPMLDPDKLQTIRLVSVGGEAFSGDLVNEWATPTRRFMNGYGPTETTVAVVLMDCQGKWETSPPIGRPLANHQVFVLNNSLKPVPVGVAGELYITGVGLARGYVNRPDLTEEVFIRNPFSDEPESRLYKTGDLVRWNIEGQLEFLGRTDRQIKIRGFRVELGEIESVLVEHPDILQAVIEVHDDKQRGRQLVAYIVMKDGRTPELPKIREYLLERLPTYMVPSRIMTIPSIPLTSNGKIDRRALPSPDDMVPLTQDDIQLPTNEIEERVAKDVFQVLLGINQVNIHGNFFDLGGNSLQAIQVVSRIREIFGVDISLVEFFQSPTIANVANLVMKYQEQQTAARMKIMETLDQIEALSEEDAELYIQKLQETGGVLN
ncbi:amino acid adenylation domain-containing protein [Brevibacillus sp. FSL K6-2834]|uniref:non-ribosomal peptide synthetase n=1 Tax=Brevibacillus sp. FSL K6-2834 TaxID=2954680 RepID=UPI003157FA0D